MYALDAGITQWINGFAGTNGVLDAIMIWISAAAVPVLVLAVAGQWWFGLDRRRTRHALIAAGLSFILGLMINQLILLFIQRMRPYDAGLTHLLISPSADFSFPSDHATATVAIAAAFLLQGMRRRGLVFLAAAVVVCLSRVYIGTHYVSDVLGGAATGMLAALVVRAVYRKGTGLDRLLTGIL